MKSTCPLDRVIHERHADVYTNNKKAVNDDPNYHNSSWIFKYEK